MWHEGFLLLSTLHRLASCALAYHIFDVVVNTLGYLRTVLIVRFCIPLWSAVRFHYLLILNRVFRLLLLVILNGASKSYTISWLYQTLYSRVLNEFRDFALTTVSGRLFHGSVIRIGNKWFLKFSLALCLISFRECPLFPVLCDISLFFNIFGTDSWS